MQRKHRRKYDESDKDNRNDIPVKKIGTHEDIIVLKFASFYQKRSCSPLEKGGGKARGFKK
jgi:hypothetical protein